MILRRCVRLSSLLCLLIVPAVGPAATVNESARQIPVAYRVDVVVVGGSTGAVQAAVAAAGYPRSGSAGANVFLAAPQPYLGDDMTATLRLWLEEGEAPETPLAKRIFSDPHRTVAQPDANRIHFTYEADQPSQGVHQDTDPPTVLIDRRWGDPARQSVQYNADVNITADLKKPQQIERVCLTFFRRSSGAGGTNFDVQGAAVLLSDDRQTWKQVAVITNQRPRDGSITLSAPVAARARYVRLSVKKPKDMERMLLGEIEIIAPAPTAVALASRQSDTAVVKYPPPRPMHVKKVLDEALLAVGVRYLYSCYVTDVLRDAAGNPCGIVMANRAGRQAVLAKTIVDATDRAAVARLAGARFRPYPAGTHTFQRVVIGGDVQQGENLSARSISPPFQGSFQIIQYTLRLPINDGGYASWAAAEQQARTMTYHPGQQFTSDWLFEVPPDPMLGRQPATGQWQGSEKLPLGAFQPAEVPRIYVLGGCADVSRPQAEGLLRPLALMVLGERIGRAAAGEAKSLPGPTGVRLPGAQTADPVVAGDVRETLSGVRPVQQLPTVPQDARPVPVLGQYDVVVIGGGTAGAPAGIAAARQGAKTLVVEYLHGLGGVGTQGAISKYYWGNRVGFTATVPGKTEWLIEQKMEWWRTQLLQSGAEIWFGCIGCGALVDGGRVTGAVIATPQGRGVVLAKSVIDATGNADVAAAAGAECLYTDASEFAMQGTGLPGRKLGETYNNTDFTITDETDLVDVWQLLVYSKDKYTDAFDHGRLVDTRERRRIVGDATITIVDQMNERTYPDSVVQTYSNFDTHGYTVDPYLLLEHPEERGFKVYVPYRAMLPKGLEGMLVVGLGISAHRDAVPLVRMQPDIQNGGYAAGVAAAMAAQQNVSPREIDVHALQQHLVRLGNLPESVLTDKDSYPMPDEKIAEAIEDVKDGRKGAAVILAHPQKALPLLNEAYLAADARHKLAYARVLATLGDPTGLEALISQVRAAPGWDRGWNYQGMGQFGAALSPLDNLIVIMGRTRDPRAVPVILEKLKLLTANEDFSHHRAAGLALELIGDKTAAEPIARLLAKPGMTGHVESSIEIVRRREAPGGTNAVATRRESLRELLLARALYRCGDYQGVGKKILDSYTKDLRGHLARHAKAVLQAGNGP